MSAKTRLIVAALVSPAIGIFAMLIATALEQVVRHYQGKPTQGIHAAGFVEGGSLFVLVPYSIFCLIVILPTVYQMRRSRRAALRNPFLISLLIASVPCILAGLFFHEPTLDKWYMTLFAMAFVLGIPIFTSSLFASIVIRAQQGSDGKPDTAAS